MYKPQNPSTLLTTTGGRRGLCLKSHDTKGPGVLSNDIGDDDDAGYHH